MKQFVISTLLGVLLGVSIPSLSSAAQPSPERSIAPGTSIDIPFVAPENPGKVLVFLNARLNAGQESGHKASMKVAINGHQLDENTVLLNRDSTFVDLAIKGSPRLPLFEPKSKAWHVKIDSDFISYNTMARGNPYNKSGYFQNANTGWNRHEFSNAHYRYIFDISKFVRKENNQLRIENTNEQLPLPFTVSVEGCESNLLVSTPIAGTLIFPWTFPNVGELNGSINVAGCRGQFVPAMVSIRNMGSTPESVSLEVGPLNTKDSLALQSDITARRILYVVPPSPRAIEYRDQQPDTKSWPSRISPASKIMLAPNTTETFWLSLRIPDNAVSGVYNGAVTIASDSAPAHQTPITVEVLPFDLDLPEITFGIWDNKLPGKMDDLARERVRDLKEHGINTITVDPWGTPIKIDQGTDGKLKVDLSGLESTLAFLRENKLNEKVFHYGVLDPIVDRLRKLSGVDIDKPGFAAMFHQVISEVEGLADRAGVELYFHPIDEPDLHPDRFPQYLKLVQLIKDSGGKVWSNNTVSGLFHLGDKVDANASVLSTVEPSFANLPYSNPFFPDWEPASAEAVKQAYAGMYLQTQVRDTTPLRNRGAYGLLPFLTGVKGIWGFCYHWNDDMHVTWPFLESDGSMGSTIGWEMLREGTYDYQYLATAARLRAKSKPSAPFDYLPPLSRFDQSSMSDLAEMRTRLITELRTTENQPKTKK